MSGTRLRDGVPNVCAKEGRDWAEWADMLVWVLVSDIEEGALATDGSRSFRETCSSGRRAGSSSLSRWAGTGG